MTADILLQLCDPNKSGVDYITDFEFIESVSCTYANAAGSLTVVGLIFYTGVASAIYIRTGSPIIPLGILLLSGGAIVSQISGVAAPFIVLLLLIFPAAVIALAYYRYSV